MTERLKVGDYCLRLDNLRLKIIAISGELAWCEAPHGQRQYYELRLLGPIQPPPTEKGGV